jgi:hypothetical protein
MVDTFVSDFDQAREAGHLMKTKILFTLENPNSRKLLGFNP